MTRFRTTALALAGLALATPVLADGPSFFFPGTTYRSAADIPGGFYAGDTPDFLETFEDGTLDGGLSGSPGVVIGPGQFDGSRDGVDGDDGRLDGVCGPPGSTCRDWFSGNGSAGVTFTYQGPNLPTAFGLVWTDGVGTVTFSAFDADGVLLGSLTPQPFSDGSTGGTTAEDRFFGVTYAGGIRSIKISNTSGGIEVDHLQYGSMVAVVPEPPAWALLAAGGLLALTRVRRQTQG